MKRLLIGLAVGTIVFGAVFAMAATLNITSSDLAAGDVSITSCDADGVGVSWTTSFANGEYQVTGIDVTGINANTCAGQTLDIRVNGNAFSGTQEITGTGTNETVSFTGVTGLTAEQVTDVDVLIAQ